jgi:threonine/homoserine/homoserine lactone efflux protein
MPFDYILKGIAIGFLMAAPIGPIGILCARGTIIYGIRRGFTIGLSGASGDIIYAIAAAFGVKLIFDLVAAHQPLMRLVGGILLIAAGLYTFRSQPKTNVNVTHKVGETGIFASTFLLALTNPLTLFGYAAAFSAIGIPRFLGHRTSIVMLIAGVFLGSSLWFSFLVWLSHHFKEKVTMRGVIIINKAAGSLLVLFGVIGVVLGLRAIWLQ